MSAIDRVKAFCVAYRQAVHRSDGGIIRSVWSHETSEWHLLKVEDLEAIVANDPIRFTLRDVVDIYRSIPAAEADKIQGLADRLPGYVGYPATLLARARRVGLLGEDE